MNTKKNLIKKNLLNFLDTMESMVLKDPCGLIALRETYAGEGAERFDADIQAAVDALASYKDFQPVQRNIYDAAPAYHGVMLYELPGRFGGGNVRNTLLEAKCSDYADMIPQEVYAWADSTLKNRAYTNVLSYVVKLDPTEIDESGHLSGLCFNYAELTYLLITDAFDFIPVRSVEITIEGPNGESVFLEKTLDFRKDFCPYELAEDLLEEIIALNPETADYSFVGGSSDETDNC